MNLGKPISLTDEQRNELERLVRMQTLDARSARRARIVLLAAAGVGNHEIARRLEISRGQAIKSQWGQHRIVFSRHHLSRIMEISGSDSISHRASI